MIGPWRHAAILIRPCSSALCRSLSSATRAAISAKPCCVQATLQRRLYSAAATMQNVVVSNVDHVEVVDLTEKQFLLTYPRGAYTTARTVNITSVFELSFHIKRLSESVALMLTEDAEKAHRPITLLGAPAGDVRSIVDPAVLRPVMVHTLQNGVKKFHELRGTRPSHTAHSYDAANAHLGECKLTLVLAWDNDSCALSGPYTLYAHITSLPPIPPPPVKVMAYGSPRQNPNAKDSQWVRDRAALEAVKPADVNEVLLLESNGEVKEGMSSNFFAVSGGAVYTADEGVLKGTVRDIVLKSCELLGVPLVLHAPNIADADKWDSAFVTSTSRLVLPIDVCVLPNGSQWQARNHAVTNEIRARVFALMVEASEPILA